MQSARVHQEPPRKEEEVLTPLRDFETRKTVHVSIMKSTHGELRAILFRRGLSMQEVFDVLASKICDGDESLVGILDEIVRGKRVKQLKRVSATDSESIYRVLESENPLAK